MAQEADPPGDADARARARLQAALDEQRRSFLRMVSHELRTPLNSILGFSEILASELYGPLGAPQYKEYAAIIHGSGQRLLRLVNQVLEIARLEARTMEFDVGGESLEAALDDVMIGLQADLDARDICILTPGRDTWPTVSADPRGLRTVLGNLLQNAVAFSPDGGQVRVTALQRDDWVEIEIQDEGEGVDPDDLPRLMGPFQQGENALTRKSEGAGLGLPIADLTCKAMSGRLRLTSQPGRGLTAAVQLPAG